MKKLLTLAATALMLASPAFADDDNRDDNQGQKNSQHWLPGGVPWQAAPDQHDRDRDGRRDADRNRDRDDHRDRWDRDGDGDHDRWDHRRDWDRDWNRNDNRWNNSNTWNNGYRYGGERNILGRWALVNFDFNRDGRLDPREYQLSQRAFFDLADRNNDGVISDKDWRKFIDNYAYRNDIGYRYGYKQRGYPRYDYNDPWRR